MLTIKKTFLLFALMANIAGTIRADQEFDINDLPEPLRSMVMSHIQQMQVQQGAGTMTSKPVDNTKITGWKRIVGHIPQELRDIERYMTDEAYRIRFKIMNTSPPKGILFEGPPGVGKTTLAKALSEQVKCAFIETKATDFTSMMMSGGAEKIRSTFKRARNAAKKSETGFCILYIDEFEIFTDRTAENTNPEIGNMVRALLAELDGFTEDTGVIVIASTNHVVGIDPAILRPGRFDSIISIDLPDEAGRLAILKFYAQNGAYDAKVQWENVAKCTNTFSPADLKEIIAKAGRLAVNDTTATMVAPAHVLAAVREIIAQNQHRGFDDVSIRLAHVETHLEGATDKVGFAAIAGTLPLDIQELYNQIKDPRSYATLGIERPKGMLLTGPPGVGKTALARALAEELNCEFISAKGSEFINKWVGQGAENIRKLFDKANRRARADSSKPVIVFIDELEAIGSRSSHEFGSNESHRTVDELLTQMDGFTGNSNVIVIGATNFPEMIDPALMRPGRFDKIVEIDLPEIDNRKAIIKKYLADLKVGKDVTIEELGRMTYSMSAAEIADMINQTRRVLHEDKRTVAMHADFTEGCDRTAMGLRKDLKQNKECLRNTAYHEIGHTLVALFVNDSYPLHKVTIVPRSMGKGKEGTFLGAAFMLPVEDVHQITQEELEAKVMVCMGGRIAEEITFNSVSAGAWNDFEKATNIVRAMVTQYGMSEKLGPIQYNPKAIVYSPKTLELIDDEVRRITNELYTKAKKLILEKQDLLKKLAEQLLKKETLYANEVYKIAGLPQPVIPIK